MLRFQLTQPACSGERERASLHRTTHATSTTSNKFENVTMREREHRPSNRRPANLRAIASFQSGRDRETVGVKRWWDFSKQGRESAGKPPGVVKLALTANYENTGGNEIFSFSVGTYRRGNVRAEALLCSVKQNVITGNNNVSGLHAFFRLWIFYAKSKIIKNLFVFFFHERNDHPGNK